MKRYSRPASFVLCIIAGLILLPSCQKSIKSEVPIVAIANYGAHPIIDVTIDAFKSEMSALGYVDGKNVSMAWSSVDGNVNLAPQMISGLLSKGPKVIVAITTPIAQAVAKQARGIVPIVFCGVTDPIGAGLVDSWENRPGSGITGTSDRWPYAEQLDLVKQFVPNAKRVGIPYNSGESNSIYAIEQINRLAKEKGLEIVPAVVTSTTEVYKAVESLLARGVDVIYTGSDNTIMAGFQSVLKIAYERRIPVIVGESANVERGGMATYSVDYSELGKETARLVDRILKGEEAGSIPVATFKGTTLFLNVKAAERMGVKVDPELQKKATILETKRD